MFVSHTSDMNKYPTD
ncbi:hypothetical protein, partial [Frankia sp. AvcI1]